MSIESLLTDLIAAVRENTAAQAGKAPKATPKAKDTVAADATVVATVAKPAAEATPAPAATPSTDDTAKRKKVAEVMMALANDKKHGRDVVIALLKKFGAAKAPDIKAESLDEFIAAGSTLLAGPAATGAADLL